jgi:hypothetical protein
VSNVSGDEWQWKEEGELSSSGYEASAASSWVFLVRGTLDSASRVLVE